MCTTGMFKERNARILLEGDVVIKLVESRRAVLEWFPKSFSHAVCPTLNLKLLRVAGTQVVRLGLDAHPP
jgi:hypothetical protein